MSEPTQAGRSLTVWVDGQRVGRLTLADRWTTSFEYLEGMPESAAISVALPVTAKAWTGRGLPPALQVSLPEGMLRRWLLPADGAGSDLECDWHVLQQVGAHLVGRVQLLPEGVLPATSEHGSAISHGGQRCGDPATLQQADWDLLLRQLAPLSGVSGGFAKVLYPRSGTASPAWILKTMDADRPCLVLNEYFGMRVAQQMGLPVPRTILADDASYLLVQRFDLTDSGRLGFEDFCSVLGLPASDKYSGSVERVIRAINTHCSGENRAESLRQFYAQYVLVNALRNTDAHLKNFGLIYTGADNVRLAPVYDMLSMGAYSPATPNGDCQDQLALMFGGSRRWLTTRGFAELARLCEVGPDYQAQVAKRLTGALAEVGQEVLQRTREDSAFRSMGQRLLGLWSQGVVPHGPDIGSVLARWAQTWMG